MVNKEKEFPLKNNCYKQQKTKQLPKHNDNFDRLIQFMALLFFIGCFTLYYYGGKTMWSWINLSRIYVSFTLVFAFVINKFFPELYKLNKELKVILVIFVLAPFFTGITLALNYNITEDNYTETYKVEKTQVYYDQEQVEVVLENKLLNDHHALRRFNFTVSPPIADSIKFTVANGLFKIKVVKNKELLLK